MVALYFTFLKDCLFWDLKFHLRTQVDCPSLRTAAAAALIIHPQTLEQMFDAYSLDVDLC